MGVRRVFGDNKDALLMFSRVLQVRPASTSTTKELLLEIFFQLSSESTPERNIVILEELCASYERDLLGLPPSYNWRQK